MFSRNLKYYRTEKAMTKLELAMKCGLSLVMINNLENGTTYPDIDTVAKLAQALDITVSDFLRARNSNLIFHHGEFRKSCALTQNEKNCILESIEEYFSRFYTAVELPDGYKLPNAPECKVLEPYDDTEKSAELMRMHLGLSVDGPIQNLTEWLENKGILLYFCDVKNDDFAGMNGFVNNRPYIVINDTLSPERIRAAIAHELTDLFFRWQDSMSEDNAEQMAAAISEAFLFPRRDAARELGNSRLTIGNDMELICKKYGISMFILVDRAEQLDIMTKAVANDFFAAAGAIGWPEKEPVRIQKEQPSLLKQLVDRAVNEGVINMQRAAELLMTQYDDVQKQCLHIH